MVFNDLRNNNGNGNGLKEDVKGMSASCRMTPKEFEMLSRVEM